MNYEKYDFVLCYLFRFGLPLAFFQARNGSNRSIVMGKV